MPLKKDDLVGIQFPSGIRNLEYGVWRSRCCGDEIVLYRGAIFPICNKHKDRLTEWVLITTDILSKPDVAAVLSRPLEPSSVFALHIPPDRLKELTAGAAVTNEIDRTHLTKCLTCRSLIEQFALEYHRQRLGGSNLSKSA